MKSKSFLTYLFLGAISALVSFCAMHLIATLLFSSVIDLFGKYLTFWIYASYCFFFLFVGLMLTFSIYEMLVVKFCSPNLTDRQNVYSNQCSCNTRPCVTSINNRQKPYNVVNNTKGIKLDRRYMFRKRTQHK